MTCHETATIVGMWQQMISEVEIYRRPVELFLRTIMEFQDWRDFLSEDSLFKWEALRYLQNFSKRLRLGVPSPAWPGPEPHCWSSMVWGSFVAVQQPHLNSHEWPSICAAKTGKGGHLDVPTHIEFWIPIDWWELDVRHSMGIRRDIISYGCYDNVLYLSHQP